MSKSRQQKKEKMQHVAWLDEKQTVFNPVGKVEQRQRVKSTVESKYDGTVKFACPICLGQHKYNEYFISTGKGIHQGLAECPECNNKFRFTTLTANFSPEEYADYIYGQIRSGIWQKIPFKKWKERLYHIGWAGAFWKRYKELKQQDADGGNIDDEESKRIEDSVKAYEEEMREKGIKW